MKSHTVSSALFALSILVQVGVCFPHSGFDDEGSQFDSNGNLVDWWEQDTKKAYLEKARCIIEQYANYTEPNVGIELNGINTQGENIADNGGIKEAYLAYKKFVDQNGEEPPLPGLNMTSNQLFWISAAQTWCSVSRPGETHPGRMFKF
jgi:neprilysin